MAGRSTSVASGSTHPMFKPLVDIRARFYDTQREPATRDLMSYTDGGETHAVANKLPYTQADWWSDRILTAAERKPFDKAPAQWLAASAIKPGTTL